LFGHFHIVDQMQNWFARGLISSGHVVFYVTGIAFFLFLTTRALESRRFAVSAWRRLAGRSLLVLAGVVALAIWAAATVLSSRQSLQLIVDVSPQAQFTFSADTNALLDELRERELTLEFDTFYEPVAQNPRDADEAHWIGLAHRIRGLTNDVLRLYEIHGGDTVKVKHHDLLRDVESSRTRREELNLSIRNSVVVTLGKRHKALSLGGDLAQLSTPSRTPLPGGKQPPPSLQTYKGEEAISSAIRSLLVEGTPKAYFLTGYGQATIRDGVADSYSELAVALTRDGFQVDEWNLGQKGVVPEDATVVALMEPNREMPDRDAEALYAYVRAGGRLLLNVSYQAVPADYNPVFPRLGELLGFEIGTDLVAHLVPDPRIPRAPGRGGFDAQNLVAQLNPRHAITAPLVREEIYPRFKVAREIRAREPRSETAHVDTSLVRTGPWAWIAMREGGDVNMAPPATELAFKERCIGALIDVDPESGGRPGAVVVLGGSAFRNEARGFDTNGDLALNIFNWMAQRRELVTVRGNDYRAHRLEVVEAQAVSVDRLLIWYVPGALALLALIVFFVRRRN
jgi:hypothetical protein